MTPAQQIPMAVATRVLTAIYYLVCVMPEVRRLFAQHSIMFFAWYYLQMDMWDHQVRWAREFLKHKRYLKVAPRGHGKSETVARVLVLWLIAHNRNIRILMVSSDIKLSRKHVINLKRELRFNPRLIADYGKFYSRDNHWTATSFTVLRDKQLKDWTLEAIGIGGTFVGSRFDIIIPDDIVDIRKASSETERDSLLRIFDGDLMPLLEPWGATYMIGTRKHAGDIYGRKIKDPTWRHSIEQAIIRYPEQYEYVQLTEPVVAVDELGQPFELWYDVVIGAGDPGEVLAPECMPMKTLLLKRKSMGTVLFDSEYQGNMIDDASALFKMEDLKACRDENLSYVIGEMSPAQRERYRVVLQGVDPSLIMDEKEAQKNERDWFVALTWGVVKDSPKRELIGFFRQRGLSPDDVVKKVGHEYARLLVNASAIETNAFGLIHHYNLVKQTGFHFYKHITGGNKHDLYQGVPGLSVLFENREISLPYKTDEDKQITDRIIEEFHGIGVDEHDDIIMAAWILNALTDRWLRMKVIEAKNADRR